MSRPGLFRWISWKATSSLITWMDIQSGWIRSFSPTRWRRSKSDIYCRMGKPWHSIQWMEISWPQLCDFPYNRAVHASDVPFHKESGRKENSMPATVEFTGDIARLILSGDFDFSTQENLNNAIEKVLNANAMREIYVDLTDATFIDSSVIRSLLRLRES